MPTTTTCFSCHAAMREGDRFCWTCGASRDAADRLEVVGPPPEAPSRRRVGGVVVAGVAVVVVVAVAASTWYLTRSDDGTVQTTAPSPAATPSTTPSTTASASATPSSTPSTPASATPSATPSAAAPSPTFPVGPVVPARASAPSTAPDSADAGGRTTSYAVSNVLDGKASTAWRAEGDASGDTLVFTFDAPVRITEVGLVNGFAKVDPYDGTDRYAQGRRITAVTWTFRTANGPVTLAQTLRDGERRMQTTAVAPVEVTEVDLTIDRTTRPGAGGRFDRTAVSDVEFANSQSDR